MNAASKLLRFLAIIGALAAGALFYLTQGKITELSGKLRDAQASVSSAQSANGPALKAAQDTADKAVQDNKALADALNAAKDAATTADNYRAAALKDLDDANKKSREKDSNISDLNDKIADLTKQAASVGDLQVQVAADKVKMDQMQALIDSGPAKPTATGPKSGTSVVANPDMPAPAAPLVVISGPFPATISLIDVKNGLIALNVGANSTVQPSFHLRLKSADQELGQVIVDDFKSDSGLATGRIISTGNMSTKDFTKIVTNGLKISFEQVQ